MKWLLGFLLLVLLAGCQCKEQTVYEKVPFTVTDEVSYDENYSYTSPEVKEVCDYRFNAKIDYEDSNWDGDTLRRVAYITNKEKETGLFTFTKVYWLKEKEIGRDEPPLQVVIEGDQTRTLYLVWNTPLDEDKELSIELVETSERKKPSCQEVIIYNNKTGVRTKTEEVNTTLFETRFKKICK